MATLEEIQKLIAQFKERPPEFKAKALEIGKLLHAGMTVEARRVFERYVNDKNLATKDRLILSDLCSLHELEMRRKGKR